MPSLIEREIRDDLLAAALSHELKTPVAALNSSLESLRRSLESVAAALREAQGSPEVVSEIAPLIDVAIAYPMAGSPPIGLAMSSRVEEVERDLAALLPAADARRAAEVIVRGGWISHARAIAPILKRRGARPVLPILDAVGRARAGLRSLELSAQRLSGLERSLRATAEALRGSEAGAEGAFDLRDCLDSAAAAVAHEVAPGTAIRVVCDPDVTAAGSREPIERVIVNLCLNALASVATRGGRVTVTGRAEGAQAVVSVEDDGAGVPDAIRDRLFMPFVTTKPRESRGGLGLFICRRIVESRGGAISFTSRAGCTRFEARLPLASKEQGGKDRGGA